MTAQLIDNLDDARLQQAQLLERKRQAQKLIDDAMTSNGNSGMAGQVYMVGNQYGNLAKNLGGTLQGALADRDMQNLQVAQNAAQSDWSDRYQNATPEQQQGLLVEARNRGLKHDLEQAFRKEEAARIERGEQAAAERQNRADIAEANRIDQGEQRAADRVARQDLRAMPTTHITVSSGGSGQGKAPSGYRWTASGDLEAIPGGPGAKAQADKPLNENQGNAMIYGTRAAQANNVLEQIGTQYSPMKLDIARGAEKVPFGAAAANTFLLKENDQKIDQAQRNFINAILRRESGASIHDSEFNNARKQYFPQQGDSPELLKQKRANRELVIKGLGDIAGPQGQKAVTAEAANKLPALQPKAIANQAEWQALPAGTPYVLPDGRKGVR